MMFFGGLMFIIPLAIIGLIVWAVIVLTRRGASSSAGGEKRSAIDIARERYARGEITREEFERLKQDLN
jgi:putative membrane protein